MVDVDAIVDIRRAAARALNRDEWVGDALDRALAGWEPAEMLALAEDVLRKGLPTFERHQPGEDWPRRALDGLVTGLSPEYMGPGGNSFSSGVEDLLEARASVHDPTECRRHVAHAISRAVMAERCAAWGAEHPEGWRRSFDAALRGTPLRYSQDPMRDWGEHPSVRRVEHALWTEIADRIADRG